MKMRNVDEDYEVDGLPVSALLAEGRVNRYGSVPGLPDEGLASPDELERQVFLKEWGPVLALPRPVKKCVIEPSFDMNGDVDWGAFASVDFERYSGGFDKARYKADRLKEELRDVLFMLQLASDKLPKAKFQVLRLLDRDIIELEHCATDDMLVFARKYFRARWLLEEIRLLKNASWARTRKQLAEVLG